ncbi:MAG TPA: hypothetical protein ENK19_01815 [Acidobacteria bacterium]|nr:hypothetical protein [Acidobacteriota bacterium]
MSRSSQPIVVFGAGRSGTTWLAEILAGAGLELIFEPLNEREVPEAAELRRTVRFLDAADATARWDSLFERILGGEIRNPWTLRAGTGGERVLVKLIRANLFMEWMLHRFDFLPVFIVRNPMAVVDSLRTEGWDIPQSWVRWMASDERLAERYLPPLDDLLGRPLEQVEIYALYWCIQNVVPYRQGVLSRIPVVRFEELARDPEAVVARLVVPLAIEITPEVLRACHRWSLMKGRRADAPAYDPTTAWNSSLSPDDVCKVERIVGRFGLEELLRR